MNKYNPNIHHRRSVRLKGYDYSQEGLYFITICTQNRICLFCEITVGANGIRPKMQLNEMGKIVETEWKKSAEIRSEIQNHDFIVMPNHFHAIVEIVPIVGAYGIRPVETIEMGVCHTPLRTPSKTIGALVRGFKSSVTKRLGYSPWQRNYHEHIIRNQNSYETISQYIKNNPEKWANDMFFQKTDGKNY